MKEHFAQLDALSAARAINIDGGLTVIQTAGGLIKRKRRGVSVNTREKDEILRNSIQEILALRQQVREYEQRLMALSGLGPMPGIPHAVRGLAMEAMPVLPKTNGPAASMSPMGPANMHAIAVNNAATPTMAVVRNNPMVMSATTVATGLSAQNAAARGDRAQPPTTPLPSDPNPSIDSKAGLAAAVVAAAASMSTGGANYRFNPSSGPTESVNADNASGSGGSSMVHPAYNLVGPAHPAYQMLLHAQAPAGGYGMPPVHPVDVQNFAHAYGQHLNVNMGQHMPMGLPSGMSPAFMQRFAMGPGQLQHPSNMPGVAVPNLQFQPSFPYNRSNAGFAPMPDNPSMQQHPSPAPKQPQT